MEDYLIVKRKKKKKEREEFFLSFEYSFLSYWEEPAALPNRTNVVCIGGRVRFMEKKYRQDDWLTPVRDSDDFFTCNKF